MAAVFPVQGLSFRPPETSGNRENPAGADRQAKGEAKTMLKVDDIDAKLRSTGYCPNQEIDYAVLIAMIENRPLLIEGAPGVGKTSIAKAVADAFELPLLRIQMYDGLTDDKILYDYDYQKQLLTLEAIKPSLEKEYGSMTAHDAIKHASGLLDFYGKEFLISRPVLKAIDGSGRKVLLIDEIDKAPEEIEYMLYEFLEDYSITIPQYGKITCPEDQRPVVFITSNCYRELSGAFRRRCNYLYIAEKTKEEMAGILMARAEIDQSLAESIAECLCTLSQKGLKYTPSIAEGIEWAEYLKQYPELTKEIVMGSLSYLAKTNRDYNEIKNTVEKQCFTDAK